MITTTDICEESVVVDLPELGAKDGQVDQRPEQLQQVEPVRQTTTNFHLGVSINATISIHGAQASCS